MNPKLRDAFDHGGCDPCRDATNRLQQITQSSQDIDHFLDGVLATTRIVVDRAGTAANGYLDNVITISHAPMKQGSHDKSLGDRMADTVIFESLNASRAGDYLTTNTTFGQDGDVRTKGRRIADIETEIMERFCNFAQALPANLRTGNMERAILRVQEAKQASKELKQYLLDLPHEVGVDPKDYMGLPTRQVYIYEEIQRSSPYDIKCIILRTINVPFGTKLQGFGDPSRANKVVTGVNGASFPANVQALLKLLDKWPGAAGERRRPRYFLEFLQKVESDAAYAAFRNSVNRAAFGFDNDLIADMARKQPSN